jgi:hypothetical protein
LCKNMGNPIAHRTRSNHCYLFHVYFLKSW